MVEAQLLLLLKLEAEGDAPGGRDAGSSYLGGSSHSGGGPSDAAARLKQLLAAAKAELKEEEEGEEGGEDGPGGRPRVIEATDLRLG